MFLRKNSLVLVCPFLFSLVAIYLVREIFQPGYPSSWDGAAHFVRLKIMVFQLMPNLLTNGWSHVWYGGFVPFQFYPNLYFIFLGAIYYLLGESIPLLIIYKCSIAGAYAGLPLAIYFFCCSFEFSKRTSLIASALILGVSCMKGLGISALFIAGLIPQGYGLLLFLLSLSLYHKSISNNPRLFPLAGLCFGLLINTHLISSVAFSIAIIIHLIVYSRCGFNKQHLKTTFYIAIISLLISLPTLYSFLAHWHLAGPGTGWGNLVIKDLLTGRDFGGKIINGVAGLGFVVCLFHLRQKNMLFLLLLFSGYLFLAIGVPLKSPEFFRRLFSEVLKNRSYSIVGLFVPVFAALSLELFFHRPRFFKKQSKAFTAISICTGLLALVALAYDSSNRIEAIQGWVQTDHHYTSPEKHQYLEAYHWLKHKSPENSVIGFDDRFKDFGSPGYNQMASRIVLESERFTLPGNQVEATNAHNSLVLAHLHDWKPEDIHNDLLRYNVSYFLSWTEDVEQNLKHSKLFSRVWKNEKVTIWKVLEHSFQYISGEKLQSVLTDFSHRYLAWEILTPPNNQKLVFSIPWHPHWKAFFNKQIVPIAKTQDNLMSIDIRDSGKLEIRHIVPLFEVLLRYFSIICFVILITRETRVLRACVHPI